MRAGMRDRRHREPESPLEVRHAMLALGFGLVIVVAVVVALLGGR